MLTIIFLTLLLAILIAYPLRKRNKLPPGPFPFPIIGNIPQIGMYSVKYGGIVNAMKQFQKEYGNVFTLWMGPQPTVHLASMEIAQETMVKRGGEFTNRWVPFIFNAVRKGLGIIGTNGAQWSEQRRFSLHTLRNFGLGRSIMEDRIMAEVNMRCETIDKEIGEKTIEMEPQHLFDLMVGSIINRMLFTEPLDGKEGGEFYTLKKKIDQFVSNISLVDFFINSQFMISLPFIKQRYEFFCKPQNDLKDFITRQIQKRRRDIESGEHLVAEEPEDYVDAFLMKMKEEEKSDQPTTYTLEALTINLFDLWIAGQETTVTTTISGFAYLLNNIEVLEKVRKELFSVTKGERSLSLKDRQDTPYYNATIMEIQRHASILNINLFRATEKDTEVGGYLVEEGTPITAELSLIMSDEKFFDNKFDPSRFLKSDKLEQQVTPFGLGKRACLGESLARAELYLIIGNMLLRYDIKPCGAPPSMESTNKNGILKRAPQYKMRISKLNI